MECPNCKYEHGYKHWIDDQLGYQDEDIEGVSGDFYRMTANAKRPCGGYYNDSEKTVNGCPSCGVMFIDVT